ncbi:MAG: CDP-diacylglycerol--glycerol-3-phosphate 3-phosphatidyltransferase [Chitinophagales bacterium]
MNIRLNTADHLSLSRIYVAPFFLLLEGNWEYNYLFLMIVVCWAMLSDYLDGYWARKKKLVSNLGAFLDFTADKVFVATVLVMLSLKGWIPAWMTLLIIGREFLVMGLRIFAAIEGLAVPAYFWGKVKTTFTFAAIMGVLLCGQLSILNWDWVPYDLLWGITYILLLIATFLTISSGFDYIRKVLEYVTKKREQADSQ